jgi:hypothetical protein
MNFNKIVRFLRISVGSLTITNIPKYTLKFRLSKVWHKLFWYFYRNSDTENNSSLFKTYAVDLRWLLCEQVVCLIIEKKGAYWSLVRDSSVVRRHYILLLEPSNVRAQYIRKTADLLLQLWVSTFPRFVAIRFYFLSETLI